MLRGSLTQWEPPDTDWVDKVVGSITQDAAAVAKFAALTNTALSGGAFGCTTLPAVQTPSNFGPGPDLSANALVHAPGYSVLGAGDAMTRGGGDSPFSNAGVTVSEIRPGEGHAEFGTTLASDPAAVSYYTRYYQPKGNLKVPTLSLHTWVDPDVPTAHEAAYRQVVSQRGASAMLRQYLVTGYLPDDLSGQGPVASRGDSAYGHCNFRPVDMVTAFEALAARANSQAGELASGGRVAQPGRLSLRGPPLARVGLSPSAHHTGRRPRTPGPGRPRACVAPGLVMGVARTLRLRRLGAGLAGRHGDAWVRPYGTTSLESRVSKLRSFSCTNSLPRPAFRGFTTPTSAKRLR